MRTIEHAPERTHERTHELNPSHNGGPGVRRLALALLAGVALMLPGATGSADERPEEIPYEQTGDFPVLDPSYRKSDHKVVLITDEALSPRSVDLEKGQLVAWISYSKAPSTVVFEREVARSMICHSLVNFSIEEDELKSAEIHSGEFASFCELKPGRYKYKVVRGDPTPGNPAAAAAKRLDGEIIVGEE